jgi:hypothetical protein
MLANQIDIGFRDVKLLDGIKFMPVRRLSGIRTLLHSQFTFNEYSVIGRVRQAGRGAHRRLPERAE